MSSFTHLIFLTIDKMLIVYSYYLSFFTFYHLDSYIYVMGGYKIENFQEHYLSSCEIYDIKQNKWNSMTSMLSKRKGCCATLCGYHFPSFHNLHFF